MGLQPEASVGLSSRKTRTTELEPQRPEANSNFTVSQDLESLPVRS